MSPNGNSLEKTHATACRSEADLLVMDDWLALQPCEKEPFRIAIVAWCETHPGVILLAANFLLWTAVVCGFHFG